ncbi:MAG TPA: transporter [Hyphomicrobiales bacterium]|jgi:hypothetical protein
MSKTSKTYPFMAALALGVGAAAGGASAHHPTGTSGGGSGPIVTISATTLTEGESAISFTFETIQLQALSDDTLIAAAAAHQHVHSLDTINSYALSYAYGVTNDLTVSLRLPWVVRTGIREGHHEHDHDTGEAINKVDNLGDTAGVGDLTLLGQYRFYNDRGSGIEAALLAGVKAPTGKTDERTDDGEELFATEFQPGTGSWDGLVGLALTKRAGRWSFDANVLYALAGDGAQDTNLGDRLLYNAAVSYRIFGPSAEAEPPHTHEGGSHHHHHHDHDQGDDHHSHDESSSTAVDLVLELNGEWNDKTVEGGETDPNSGGNTVYLSPGVRVSSGDLSGFVSVGIPIVNELNGIQAEPDWRVVTGVSVSFD